MWEASHFDQGGALYCGSGLGHLNVHTRHPLSLEIPVLEQNPGNHDAAEPVPADRTRHRTAFGGRTAGRGLHMTILTDRALQNFSWNILLRDVLHLVEMAGGAVVRSAEEVRLRCRMHEVLFRIFVGAIDHLPRLDLECRGRTRRLFHLLNQMTRSAADPLDLRLTGQDLRDNVFSVLREHRRGRYMTGQASTPLFSARIRLHPDAQNSAKDR